ESVVEAATTAGNYGVATDANAMLSNHQELRSSSVLIWTTTPWTIPGNRAISFSLGINYGLYRVTEAPEGNWVSMGRTLIIADKLANEVSKAAKVSLQKVRDLPDSEIWNMMVSHPLATHDPYYANLTIPLLEGDYVTDDTGTGFVHMAPGHGREDFDLWMANGQNLTARAIDTHIPFMIDADGFYTDEAPGFGPSSTEGKPGRVITDKGDKGDANERVIKALIAAGNLVARGRLKHQYPHSWRSKKPIIFRNTPQWFIAMDKAYRAGSGANEKSLRDVALNAITQTRWVPASGENRIHGMIANRPDWVMSRQRAWGVPIAIFANETGEILQDAAVNKAIADAFEVEGADAWFAPGAAARFLAGRADASQWHQVQDVLDVWFDSGSTHAYVLDDPKHFPALAEIHRKVDGGRDEVMYLEGSDQHRGWFHSSLLESCGTRGRAPFDVVLTHGFTLDEKGRKMSKSLGNTVVPQKIIEASGADILRLWVASVDYSDDQRIGPEILKSVSDNYRKLRNTIRWMLGTLAHYDGAEHIGGQGMEETERLMLHRLVELDAIVRAAFETFDYNKVLTSITSFITADLSAFYFDIRKDALYCDAPSSSKRQGALETIEHIFQCVVTWLAPILVFTCEEAWLSRYPTKLSVHLEAFPTLPTSWQDVALGDKWAAIRKVRSVVTGALEIERANKNIGSSLEAAPEVYIEDAALLALVKAVDMAEVCITSDIKIIAGQAPAGAFQLGEVPGVGVVVRKATGIKCARSWKYFDAATALPGFADVTPRDAEALQELKAMGKWPQ
ncbi:MAG: isoleucine--tRNA ligase, partial [Hyphomicrobiales bacterium]|nr:isoleucine--tRNA ligase [Hyphomicrobiales bacterium]